MTFYFDKSICLNVVVLGDTNVGKTSLFNTNKLTAVQPTSKVNYSFKYFQTNDVKINLKVRDLKIIIKATTHCAINKKIHEIA